MQGLVSHWNLIHIACHEAARRADASLRVAKREWEGATLRNGGTLTNNLMPVGYQHSRRADHGPRRTDSAQMSVVIMPKA